MALTSPNSSAPFIEGILTSKPVVGNIKRLTYDRAANFLSTGRGTPITMAMVIFLLRLVWYTVSGRRQGVLPLTYLEFRRLL